MTKGRLNLRKVVAIAICLAGITVFSGCEKPEDTKGKPSAVMNLTATAGNGQVSLSWNAPSNDGGSEITGYEVTMDNWANKVTKTASERSHTYTGLTNGTKYTFKVRAVNAKGNGEEATATATPTNQTDEFFTVKSGKLTYRYYDDGKWEEVWTIIFDDYGRKIRRENRSESEPEVTSVLISNYTTGKGYTFVLGVPPAMYGEGTCSEIDLLVTYLALEAELMEHPNYKKEADRVIAGKTCSVCSWGYGTERIIDASWCNIRFAFLRYDGVPEGGSFEVTSYSDFVPSDDLFLPPPGWTKRD